MTDKRMPEDPSGIKFDAEDDLELGIEVTKQHAPSQDEKRRLTSSSSTSTTASCMTVNGTRPTDLRFDRDRIGGWTRPAAALSRRFQERQDHTRAVATSGLNSDIPQDPCPQDEERFDLEQDAESVWTMRDHSTKKDRTHLANRKSMIATRTADSTTTSRFDGPPEKHKKIRWAQSVRILQLHAKQIPDFKAQVNSRSTVNVVHSACVNIDAEVSDTVRSSDAIAEDGAKITASCVPNFKDQVRWVTSAENKSERYPQFGKREEELDAGRRDAPTQTASVWNPNTVPAVPAIRVDNRTSRSLMPESPLDPAISLNYEGPTEEEIKLLRLKVVDLQSRLRDQDETIRKLRESLGGRPYDLKARNSNAHDRLRYSKSRRYMICFSIFCVASLVAVFGVIFGHVRHGGEASLLNESPSPNPTLTSAPSDSPWANETVLPSTLPAATFSPATIGPEIPAANALPLPTLSPTIPPTYESDFPQAPPPGNTAGDDKSSSSAGRSIAVIVALTVVGGLLVFTVLVSCYLWKKTASESEAEPTRFHQSIAAELEVKLSDRVDTAQELNALLQRLTQYDFEE